MIYTTLNKIREHNPCENSWKKLLKHLGKTKPDDEPLGFDVILESNGLDDALWCCRTAPEHSKTWRLLAVAFAREVQHLMQDERSLRALDVAERHACGEATDVELRAARDAAWDAAWAIAWDAFRAATWAAGAAAGAAAWAIARDAARDAAWATGAAAGAATWDAAWAAAGAATLKKQKEIFIATINERRKDEAEKTYHTDAG